MCGHACSHGAGMTIKSGISGLSVDRCLVEFRQSDQQNSLSGLGGRSRAWISLLRRASVPEPDPATWRKRNVDDCAQIRDQYLNSPGISRAALAMVATNLDVLRANEGMLAILLAGGVDSQTAAWAIDALSLYVSAYVLEASLVAHP